MEKYFIITATFWLIASCGQKSDSTTQGGDFVKAKPQGFMITDMNIENAREECNSDFGARLNFIPRDNSKDPVSLVQCFN